MLHSHHTYRIYSDTSLFFNRIISEANISNCMVLFNLIHTKTLFLCFYLSFYPTYNLYFQLSSIYLYPLTFCFRWDNLTLSDQIRSVAQSCPTLCDPMNHSTPGLPVHHQLPEFTQTHIHRVSDAIQPSHPLSSPSPLTPNPSQHQSLF